MHRSLTVALFAGVCLGQCGTLPDTITYPGGSSIRLPDPFLSLNGSRVASKTDWACRQQQISAIFQRYELGPLPAVD